MKSLVSCFHWIAIATVGAPFLHAAVLSEWNFDNVTTSASNQATGLTAQPVSVGTFGGTVGPNSTVPGVGGTATFVFPVRAADYVLTATESGALAANHTLSFTVAPDPEHSINFDRLSFYAWGNTGLADQPTDAYNFFLRNDLTGEVTLGTFSSNLQTSSAPTAASQYTLSLNSIPALQNVTSSTTFTVGIYMNRVPNATNYPNTGNLRIDSVMLEGSVSAIPETASVIFAAISFVPLLRRRRC